MVQQTTTFIQLVNKVLENIGERPVISFNSSVARKASDNVRDAIADVAYAHDWMWLKTSTIATSWVNEVAELGDVQTIHQVSYNTGTSYRLLSFLDEMMFDQLNITSGIGEYFTFSVYGGVRVNPYPITNEEQVKYRFYITKDVIKPVVETDIIQIPDKYIPLVALKACEQLSMSHLDDAQAVQLWNAKYNDLLTRLRSKERDTPQNAASMFKFRGSK